MVTTGDPFEVVFDIPADYDMELAPEKATILLMKAKSNDYVASIGTFDVGTAVAVAKANKAATFTATVPENYGIEPGPYFLAIIDSVTHTVMGHCCGDQAKVLRVTLMPHSFWPSLRFRFNSRHLREDTDGVHPSLLRESMLPISVLSVR